MQKNSVELNDIAKYVLVILYIIMIFNKFWCNRHLSSTMDISRLNKYFDMSLYFIFFFQYVLRFISKIILPAYIYIYIFYFVWNGLSYFYAVNPVETLINLPRIGNTFSLFYFVIC